MSLPTSWPPREPSGIRSIRFFVTGAASANYADNAYMFADGGSGSANPFTPQPYVPPGGEPGKAGPTVVPPTPTGTGQDIHDVNASVSFDPVAAPTQQGVPPKMVWSGSIMIANDGSADLHYSFDGVNDHGVVKQGEAPHWYYRRYEAGIAVKGTGAFRVVAW